MSTVTRDAEGTITGNTYDKYGSTNPVVKRLMAGFERTLDELWAKASPRRVLDVGCGEGVLTHKWAQRLRDGRVVGIDLEDPAIQAEWAKRQAPNLEYRIMKAERFPFADGEFELAAAIEVLEHVPDPEHTVSEMARVARGGHLLVSVSVIYRPIEQLLSRTIAGRRARGLEGDHPLKTPLIIQGSFALAFLVVAFALRGPIEDDLFDGSSALYWVLV